VHAFTDDALGDDDAVGLARRLRHREVSAAELRAAVAARLARVEPELRGVQLDRVDAAVPGSPDGPLAGVPTLVKDNTDVAGWPTGHGSAAFTPGPARAHAAVTRQLLAAGLDVLGKSRMPEFGFNASTEFDRSDPVRNPWDTRFSAGASSGGAAALVAAGVLPIAHANDGGGSIRIPAAACGLVGLKPSLGRTAPNANNARMAVPLVADGVVSRSVRDTAVFLAAADRTRPDPTLPPLGLVEGPANRRLRIGLVLDSPAGGATDGETRAAVEETGRWLEKLGHDVTPTGAHVGDRFAGDFIDYWCMLGFLAATGGRLAFGRTFDAAQLDPFSRGLAARYRRVLPRTPAVLRRLSRVRRRYAELFRRHDVLLSPVLAHVTPELGFLSPVVPFDELLRRLVGYVGFTPLNNVAGTPGISLPAGTAANGLPIGVHLSAARGDERTLLELGYALEADHPWRRITAG
jgi:amidase